MSEPTNGNNEEKSRKPFVCSSPGCDQRFSTSERLEIHKQKHQMTLKLGPSRSANLQDVLPIDQTPTPTRFLHLGNQVGLFDELKENPFDREFKTAQKDGGITPKQRRAASVVQQLQLRTNNHKSKTPTTPTWPINISSGAEAVSGTSQPVHVITLTPTLPSPGLLPGAAGQYFLPPLMPSPQGIPGLPGYTATSPMQVPATLLSPTLMPFPPGFIPNPMMADAQQRAFAQAMFAAAASAASPLATTATSQPVAFSENSAKEVSSTRTISTNNVISQHNVPTLILPKQERPMSVASVGSDGSGHPPHGTSVIQRASTGSNEPSYDTTSHAMSYPMMTEITDVKRSAVTMAANNHITMPTTATLPSVSSLSMLPKQQAALANQQQQPLSRTSSSNDFGSSSNLAEAKQKLKETITNNNPNLQQVIAAEHFNSYDDYYPISSQRKISSSSDSSLSYPSVGPQGEDSKPAPRRRGRQQQDIDPDIKRQRFLERNRAAASRCRNKKKKWVNGLESKAKGLTNLNVQLQNEIASLKDEIASLKQLLLSHRDCPITKMQQQSMAMAGINLNTLEPSTPSTMNLLDAVVKSESPGSSGGEGSAHHTLSSTLSSGSMDDNLRSSNPNLAMQQPTSQPQSGSMANGQMMYPNIIASSAGTT
uniref:ATF2/7 Cyclic AMP-dependent transcription factor n=1 Tax=Phallusia mammillata TaxID=59560 RepID=A0A6F9D6B0_9ASCI|nr:ATF2/7 Cyclic AMP-dependent transcription factor [Phallusia mammillata]